MRVSNVPFNLSFINGNGDEVIVHSLADLSANFNLSDLWEHFESGNLARWLNTIGEPQMGEKVNLLQGIQDKHIVLPRLCEILGLPQTHDTTPDTPIAFDESKNAFRQLESFRTRIDHLIESAERLCRNESSEREPSEDELAKIDEKIRLCNEDIHVINLRIADDQHVLSFSVNQSHYQEEVYKSQHELERAQKELEKLQNKRATLSSQIEKYRSYESNICCDCGKSVRLSSSAWCEHKSLQQELLALQVELPQGMLLEKVEITDSMCSSCLVKHLNVILRQIIDYEKNITNDLISVLQEGDILPGKMYSRASGGVTILLENGLHAFCALTELEKDVRASLTQCLAEHRVFPFEVIGAHLGEGKNQRGQVTLSRKRFWNVKDKTSTQYTEGCVVTGTIQAQVHGGLLVDVDGVEAFLPGSQVDVSPVRDFTTYIGRRSSSRSSRFQMKARTSSSAAVSSSRMQLDALKTRSRRMSRLTTVRMCKSPSCVEMSSRVRSPDLGITKTAAVMGRLSTSGTRTDCFISAR